MAHELDMTNGRAAMAYVGNQPWHGLGQTLVAGASIEDWQVAAGMDWKIQRSRVRYAVGADETDPTLIWGDKHVLFRSDNQRPLGVVSDSYKLVQPGAVLEFFRDLVEDAGFQLETAGCLFDGRRFWALARITADNPILDLKDKVGGFVLLSTSADGTLSTNARFTTVRVVCNNTLSLALGARRNQRIRGGEGVFTLPHSATFDPMAAKAHLGLSKPDAIREGFEAAMADFRRLASKRLTTLDMTDATFRLFGHDSTKMTQEQVAKAAKAKPLATIGTMAVTGQGLIGAEMAGGQGTAWGWLNAVTQYVDHAARTKTQDLRLNSALFGNGDVLKRRALTIAQQMADGSVTFIEREQTDEEFHGDVLGAVLDATPAA